MSGGILSRFRRKPASVSELVAQARANAARASNQEAPQAPAPSPQPSVGGIPPAADETEARAPRRPGPIVLSVALMLGIALAGVWGVARLSSAPHEVQASNRPEASPQRSSASAVLPRADAANRAPSRTVIASPTQNEARTPAAVPSVSAASNPPPPALLQTSSASPPAPEALEGAPDGAVYGAGVVDIVSQGEPLRLRVLTSTEARSLSSGRWTQGLQVVEAGAGNRLDVRNGDVIYDLCDRAGDQSAAEIVAALTSPAAPTCVTFMRSAQRTPEPTPN